jgi:hypothetical protein
MMYALSMREKVVAGWFPGRGAATITSTTFETSATCGDTVQIFIPLGHTPKATLVGAAAASEISFASPPQTGLQNTVTSLAVEP